MYVYTHSYIHTLGEVGRFVWNSEPHTCAQRRSNIQKALDHISTLSNMSRRFLSGNAAEAICGGDWIVIMGTYTINTYAHTSSHIYTDAHTYTHTHIHTYIHTYMC